MTADEKLIEIIETMPLYSPSIGASIMANIRAAGWLLIPPLDTPEGKEAVIVSLRAWYSQFVRGDGEYVDFTRAGKSAMTAALRAAGGSHDGEPPRIVPTVGQLRDLADRIADAATQVEALTKERDATASERDRAVHACEQIAERIDNLTKERDDLREAFDEARENMMVMAGSLEKSHELLARYRNRPCACVLNDEGDEVVKLGRGRYVHPDRSDLIPTPPGQNGQNGQKFNHKRITA